MRFFFRLTAPRCPGMAAGAVSLRKSHDIVIIVRFLVLVTTMVTKVDHSNHRSNDRSNHRGYYDGYYDRY